MRFLVTPLYGGGCMLLRVDEPRALPVATFSDEAVAVRTAVLLDRHGMLDVPIDALGKDA